jgi:hypothetical protein
MGNLTQAIVSLTGAVEDNSEVNITTIADRTVVSTPTTTRTFTPVDGLGTF